ncbi:MAG: CHAT domain-containing protein, partial [Leptolyngbyaceae cyanobacterium bins.302]|nr:CHAT domain-containing protein [Leptolyngbyaceae cyanobacterium bins.302]
WSQFVQAAGELQALGGNPPKPPELRGRLRPPNPLQKGLSVGCKSPGYSRLAWWNTADAAYQQVVSPMSAPWVSLLVSVSLLGMTNVGLANAQSITPANDGMNTIVTPAGNRYDITGGTLSGNGANLFHSFGQFGLTPGQIANFIANPQLQNILGRVVGNNPSVIDGLIQVTGGSPNLYLINPAGILFGANASLNVPASFTATTANAIGFGCSTSGVGCEWFSATGNSTFGGLNGAPNGFAFSGSQLGAIVNAGNLAVNSGQSLALVGGTIVNTGQLTAPAGQLVLSAVPGQTFVRLSQAGNPLSLEFQPLAVAPANAPSSVPTLAQLLTGGNLGNATGLTVNPDGSVRLVSSGAQVPTQPGTAIASGNLTTSGQTGGTIAVLGDRVGLVGANLNASGTNGGGNVFIGGDYQGGGTLPTASQTFISSDSGINANALQTGNGGRVIVWANGTTTFGGTINARGGAVSGDGGFVEVSGKDTLVFRGNVDTTAANGQTGTLLLDPVDITIVNGGPGADDNQLNANVPNFGDPLGQINEADGGAASFTISENALQALAATTSVVLQATNNIIIQDLADNALTFAGATGSGGSISFTAGNSIVMQDTTDTIVAASRDIFMTARSLSLGNINTSANLGTPSRGGNITLTATNGTLTAGNLTGNGYGAQAGAITVTSNTSTISVGQIQSSGTNTFGGPISGNTVTLQTFTNGGDITFNTIDTRGVAAGIANANGGNVNILARGRVVGTGSALTGGTTIATQGTNAGTNGIVTIQHDGGPTNQAFVIGAGAGATNGTAGGIDAGGTEVITSQTFGFPSSPFSSPAGRINVTFLNDTPTINTVSSLPSTAVNQPVNFTVASLGLSTFDLNADSPLFVRVVAIAPGAILRINGVDAVVGSVIPAGAALEFVPPPGFVGNLANAFSVTVDDVISTSAPRAIALTVTQTTSDSEIDLDGSCVLTSCNSPPSFNPQPTATNGVLTPTPPEEKFTRDFAAYLGIPEPRPASIDEQREILSRIERDTGVKPAFVYVSFVPASLKPNQVAGLVAGAETVGVIPERSDDQLEVLVVTAQGNAVRRRIPAATRDVVMQRANDFRLEVADPRKTRATRYLAMAQQLHRWLIAPVQQELNLRQINNLVFLMDTGLRSLPVAALHNGQQFLVEQYSIGLMPSISLSDTRFQDIRDTQLLTLGIYESTQGQPPLPSVQVEVATLVNELWSGRAFLNQAATLSTLKTARQDRPYGIIHLATHADFLPGSLDRSFIQLWEERLQLNQVRQLGWNNPQVQLLVLSACSTALGDREAELGFGGLAVQSGVKSALASLWAVNDAATAALITRFYKDLQTAPIKAEALRAAQQAMIRGELFVKDNQIQGVESQGIPLPEDISIRDEKLSHPYYWSSFTMIGSPW